MALERIERRYGLPNLSLVVHADRHLASRPYEELVRILVLTFTKVEALIDQERPDALLFESIDSLATLALYSVATDRGIKAYVLDAGRVVGRVAVHHDYQQRWQSVDRAFEGYRSGPFPDVARNAAVDFIDRFRSRRPQPPYLGVPPSLRPADVGRLVRGSMRHLRDRNNITRTGPRAMVRQRVTRLARDFVVRTMRYFDAPVTTERYVLFPLHFQPETTTLVCAPFFVDQPALVANISKSLPAGVRLYVKEHAASVGRRPLSEYRRIRSLWNTRLISPYANSFSLIEHAEAVLAITSTMGWEAILLERPVICFGEVFYNSFPLVVRADAVAMPTWPELFARTLREWQPDRELLLRYVAAVLDGTFEASLLFDNPYTRPEVMAEDNVRAIADVLARAMHSGQ